MKARSPSAVAYLRVSTEEQRHGPKAQRDAIERFAASQGLAVRSWHLDQGVSGAAPLDERPALLEAIAALHAGDILLVAKRDRLARDTFEAAFITRAVQKRRAEVHSTDGFNDDTPESRFIRTIMDGAAELERGNIRARTKAALQAKKKRNEQIGTVPFGFKRDPSEPVDADVHHLVVNHEEQSVIARVRALRKDGLSYRRIARVCRQEELMSRSHKPLQETQIQRILRGSK